MSSIKQRKKTIEKAVKAMNRAAEALSDLQSICIEFGIDITTDEYFSSELRERAYYWEKCTWWRNA